MLRREATRSVVESGAWNVQLTQWRVPSLLTDGTSVTVPTTQGEGWRASYASRARVCATRCSDTAARRSLAWCNMCCHGRALTARTIRGRSRPAQRECGCGQGGRPCREPRMLKLGYPGGGHGWHVQAAQAPGACRGQRQIGDRPKAKGESECTGTGRRGRRAVPVAAEHAGAKRAPRCRGMVFSSLWNTGAWARRAQDVAVSQASTVHARDHVCV